jgi:hypothetical protein
MGVEIPGKSGMGMGVDPDPRQIGVGPPPPGDPRQIGDGDGDGVGPGGSVPWARAQGELAFGREKNGPDLTCAWSKRELSMRGLGPAVRHADSERGTADTGLVGYSGTTFQEGPGCAIACAQIVF